MKGSGKYKINGAVCLFLCFIGIIVTVSYIGIFLSYLQFWKIEQAVFKNDFFRIKWSLKIASLLNLFIYLFTFYGINIHSTFILNIASVLQLTNIFLFTIFLILVTFSFESYYESSISGSYISDYTTISEINSRYKSGKIVSEVTLCKEEFVELLVHYKTYMIGSCLITGLVWVFVSIALSIKDKEVVENPPEIIEKANAAMDSISLRKVRVVDQ